MHELVETYVDRIPWYEGHQRHWCPYSERYAPAEVLVAYLRHGWELDDRVNVERVHFGASRYSEIYYFTLWSAGCSIEIPVISNPVVRRIIRGCPSMVLRSLDPDPVYWPICEDHELSEMRLPVSV